MKYRKIPHLSSNMVAMLVYLKRRNRSGVHASILDKRTLKALFSRGLITSGRRDHIFLTIMGQDISRLAKYYR